MLNQIVADFSSVARYELEHAVRQARFFHHFNKFRRHDRRRIRRFQQYRVACYDGCRRRSRHDRIDRFNEYLHKFGLYQKTGVDLPGEVSSKINYKYDFDKASTAYGQASAITPIQQLQAVTAIANNGKMMKPYVIDHIVDPDTKKVVKQTKPEQVGTPISADTAKKVRNLLGEVVTSDIGTGKPYKIEGFDVAGKTGTAQIAGTGGYLKGTSNYVFSFMGMAPKNDPIVRKSACRIYWNGL